MEFENDTKNYDQHFLVDKRVINTLIDTCNFKITDSVIEIGPGKCSISEIIAKKTGSLLLIECDRRLSHFVNVLMDKYDNVNVLWDNVLDVYLPVCDKIVSSLPYSITEPFIEKLLRCDFKEAVLIVGRNYANGVIENNHNKLSLLTNSFFSVEKIMDITPDSFEPKPRVMSSLIIIKRLKRSELLSNPKMFIMREMFFNRSRKLKNNLVESFIEYEKALGNKLTKRESKELIEKFNIDKKILDKEMENLSNDEYNIIYESISIN